MKNVKKTKFVAIILLISLCFCLNFSFCNTISCNIITQQKVFAEENIFNIENEEDLNDLQKQIDNGDSFKDKKIYLMCDITVNSSFESIGRMPNNDSATTIQGIPFQGEFYGNKYTISGLSCPLFEYTVGAKIESLSINGTIKSDRLEKIGSFVCWAEDTLFFQCKNQMCVTNDNNDIKKNLYTGGIVGYALNCTFEQCSNNADIINTGLVNSSYVGGLVGYLSGGSMNNCYVYDSKINATAKKSSNLQNILPLRNTDHRFYLTNVGAWFSQKQNEYKAEMQKIKQENESCEKYINDFIKKATLASSYIKTIKVFGIEVTDWVSTIAMRTIYGIEATIAFVKLGIEGSWETAFKVGWNQLKINVLSRINKNLEELRNSYGAIFGNNNACLTTDMTKEENIIDAYAFGLAYSNTLNNITNCYSANVSLLSGCNQIAYKYVMQFEAEYRVVSHVDTARASTDSITILIKQQQNLRGVLSNNSIANNKNCYYFDNNVNNLELFVDATNMSTNFENNLYGTTIDFEATFIMQGSILEIFKDVWIENQKVKLEIENNTVFIYGAKDGNGQYINITSPTELVKSYPEEYNSFVVGKKSNKSDTLPNGFDSNIWAIDSKINDGFPHLKYRYWQDIEL